MLPIFLNVSEKATQTELELSNIPNQKITMNDVIRFLEETYTHEAYQTLKTQLNLLEKKPIKKRYSDNLNQFLFPFYKTYEKHIPYTGLGRIKGPHLTFIILLFQR